MLLAASIVALCAQVATPSTRFDPARDLPGFEAIYASTDRDLYPVDEFADLLGKELDAKQLADTVARWKAAQDAVAKQLADLANDPKGRFEYRTAAHLAKHKYFSKIGSTTLDGPAPFVMLVQKPSKDDPQHAAGVVARCAPWLAKLAESFHTRVAVAAGVVANPDGGACLVAVLASKGDFDNALKFVPWNADSVEGGTYDTHLRLAVTYDDPFDVARSPSQRVRPLLMQATDALLQLHQAKLERPASLLLTIGLPYYLVPTRSGGPETLDRPEPRPDMLRKLADLVQNREQRDGYLMPCRELFGIADGDGVGGVFERLAQRAPSTLQDSRGRWSALQAQCALWTHFLRDADDAKRADLWIGYARAVLGGKSGLEAFDEVFARVDAGKLDRDFYRWVLARTAALDPTAKVDTLVVDDLFERRATPAEPLAAAATPVAPAAEPPFDPRSLAIGAGEFEARHGLALLRARRGDLDGALADLTTLVAAAPPAPYGGRATREAKRMAAAIQLRDAWLDQLAKKSARLAIVRDGKTVGAPLAKVERGTLYFGENKSGLTTLPVSALDPLEIAKQTEKKELQAGCEPWARGYVFLLCGDERWDKLVKPDSEVARDVREDAQVWFASTRKSGLAAEAIATLASSSAPRSRGEGEAVIALVKPLAPQRDTPIVGTRLAGLTRLTRDALGAIAKDLGPRDLVHGACTESGDRMRLAYDFHDAAQLADFEKTIGAFAEDHKMSGPLTTDEAHSTIAVQDGWARLRGAAAWKLPIGFAAPYTISYTWRVPALDGEMAGEWRMDVDSCHDGKSSYVQWNPLGWLRVYDMVHGQRSEGRLQGAPQYFEDTDYHVTLTHDGTKVVATLEGEVRCETKVGAMQAGAVCLYVHADRPFDVDDFVIEGRVDPGSLDDARAAWVKRELAAIGF